MAAGKASPESFVPGSMIRNTVLLAVCVPAQAETKVLFSTCRGMYLVEDINGGGERKVEIRQGHGIWVYITQVNGD